MIMHCPKCNAQRETRRGACPVCGFDSKRTAWLIVGIVAAVLALSGLLVWGVFSLVHSMSEESPPTTPTTIPDKVSTSATTLSRTVTVTVPEGYTVQKIAALMEAEDVCTAEEFLHAVREGDFSEYTFLSDVTCVHEDGTPNGRYYRLEGYLFPDTYEFYRRCSGEAAVRRFLDNFQKKYEVLQPALQASGFTLDEAVTLASIVQREAGAAQDMPRISRVLQNRLQSPSYPRLQCDVSTAYLRELVEAGETPVEAAYDTYVCRGLPVGAIANPGWAALTAAVSPSNEEICANCYFFVYDATDGSVYYSATYAEHLAVWAEIQERMEG